MKRNIRLMSSNYSATGELTPEKIQWAADHGFCSILNLQLPDELGNQLTESKPIQAFGLVYAQSPVRVTSVKEIDQALEILARLPKPVLVHCHGGYRAIALSLVAIAIEKRLNSQQFIERIQAHGLSLEQPPIRQFYEYWFQTRLLQRLRWLSDQ